MAELHMCGITGDGKMWHTSGSTDGSPVSWSAWQEVTATAAGHPGFFSNLDCARVAGQDGKLDLHVCGVTQGGKLWHTIQLTQGEWQPFEDLGARIGGNWGAFQRVRMAELVGQLHICVIVQTSQGQWRILHSVRHTNGTWESFVDINQPQLAGFPGSFVNVDCTGLWDVLNQLHVCGVTQDGKLWHTIYSADPAWLPFIDVQVISAGAPGSFQTLSIALQDEKLHVCTQSQGDLWHTMRLPDTPGWLPTFDNIKMRAGNPGSFSSISCANVDGQLHLCGATRDGKLWHTVFTSDTNTPGWHSFEGVTAAGGNPGPIGHVCITGDPPRTGPGGEDPICAPIHIKIGNNTFQMQVLQRQRANTHDPAAIALFNRQIAGLQQTIASLQQQARGHNCHF